jgi:hypothetical protein
MLELSEDELLAKPDTYLPHINLLLQNRQFSLEFLAKTVEWYDSWVCLRTQKHLTPAFCFRYLFNNATDTSDNWTDHSDIVRYFMGRIEDEYYKELERRRLYSAGCDK